MNLFEKMEIWRPMKDKIAVYICFKDIQSNLFYVQSVNFIFSHTDKDIKNYQTQLSYELFLDELPSDRSKGSKSIVEAIEEFNKSFEGD
ncbi:MAG TPA: hypothetical protein PK453_26015 [Leptospiraceae bacterium]|nr:hypothetical protein [Leptospiraceae bacterium]HNF27750.1 hypothetical protein [Leptospiraceae bacterium]HNI95211.1 hypothetical protein [Leptospiraceae bacterium]HNM05560.1 hypothetical protein [Leptospiraceae bacterium]